MFLVVLIAVLGFVSPVWADDTTTDEDPAVLFISAPTCAPGACATLNHHDLNALGRTSLKITDQNMNGITWPALNGGPVLLILAFPNVSSTFVAPTVTLSQGTGSAGGPNVYPSTTGKWDANGFAGFFTGAFSTPSGNNSVYSFIGLINNGTGSDNFANFSSADAHVNSMIVGGFGIVVYELTGTGLAGGGTLTVNFSSQLPVGTFAVAYGCSSLTGGKLGACPSQNTFGTPFTQAGIVVPEPATLILLGSGLLVTGALRRRHKKQRQTAGAAL